MNTIVRHIEFLASRRDCVIIPTVGALLARYESAHYDEASRRMVAPSRVFSFNASIEHSDGELVWSVARSQRIDYDRARAIVDAEIDAMRHQLRSQGAVSLGRLGVLRFDSSADATVFEPYAASDVSVATSFLHDVEAVPLSERVKAVVAEVAVAEVGRQGAGRWRKIASVAASVAVLVAVCFAAMTPLKVDDAALASLAPSIERVDAEKVLPQPRQQRPLIMAKQSAPLYIDVDTSYRVMSRAIAGGKYCVVVSSHTTEADAQSFLKHYNNPKFGILEKDGRYRVYAAAYASMQEATAGQSEIAANYPGAWICRR